MKLELNKEYRTRNGLKARVIWIASNPTFDAFCQEGTPTPEGARD